MTLPNKRPLWRTYELDVNISRTDLNLPNDSQCSYNPHLSNWSRRTVDSGLYRLWMKGGFNSMLVLYSWNKYNCNRIIISPFFCGDTLHIRTSFHCSPAGRTNDANNFTINLSQPAVLAQNAALVKSERLSIRFGPVTVLFSVKGYYNHWAWKEVYESSFPTQIPPYPSSNAAVVRAPELLRLSTIFRQFGGEMRMIHFLSLLKTLASEPTVLFLRYWLMKNRIVEELEWKYLIKNTRWRDIACVSSGVGEMARSLY